MEIRRIAALIKIDENVSHVDGAVLTAYSLRRTEVCGVWDGIKRTVGRWKYDESKCTHKD